MNDQEEILFSRYEQQTNHRQLLKLTELFSRIGWVAVFVSLAVLYVIGDAPAGYYLLGAGLLVLVLSFCLGVFADRVRKRIQDKVDAELGSNH